MPGRGAGAPGMGGFNFATISARGGTTGRAVGWPARIGRDMGRIGTLDPGAGDGLPISLA